MTKGPSAGAPPLPGPPAGGPGRVPKRRARADLRLPLSCLLFLSVNVPGRSVRDCVSESRGAPGPALFCDPVCDPVPSPVRMDLEGTGLRRGRGIEPRSADGTTLGRLGPGDDSLPGTTQESRQRQPYLRVDTSPLRPEQDGKGTRPLGPCSGTGHRRLSTLDSKHGVSLVTPPYVVGVGGGGCRQVEVLRKSCSTGRVDPFLVHRTSWILGPSVRMGWKGVSSPRLTRRVGRRTSSVGGRPSQPSPPATFRRPALSRQGRRRGPHFDCPGAPPSPTSERPSGRRRPFDPHPHNRRLDPDRDSSSPPPPFKPLTRDPTDDFQSLFYPPHRDS